MTSTDETDGTRASRGFGRVAYLDGLVDAPAAPANPVAGPGTVQEQLDAARRREPEKESQPVGDLGKRFALGATEIGAALPEAAAVAGAGNPNASALFADEEVKRAQDQIRNAEARLADLPERDMEGRQRILDVIDAEQKKIAAYQPLVDLADGPLKPAAKDRPLFKRGDELRQASLDLFGTPDPQFDDRFRSKLAEGAGSMVGFVAATIGTGVLGGALAGSAVNASEMYNRAIEAGATEEQAKTAAYLGSLVGTSEVLPIGRALKLLPAGARGKVTNAVGRRITDAFMSAGEEGAQEAMQEISNNLIEKGLWNPEKNAFEGAGESALIGAILGGGVGAIASTPSDPDPERLNSPRLTESDRASPIPNSTIDDGKAIIDDLLSGEAPAQPSPADPGDAPVAPVVTAAPPQAPVSTPDAPAQPEAGDAPVRPAQTPEPQAQTMAPAAPQGDTDTEVIPVMDEKGNATGDFVRVNPATGLVEKVHRDAAPRADTAIPEQPQQEPARADAAEDLDQPETAAAPGSAPADIPQGGPVEDVKPKRPGRTILQKRPVAREIKTRGLQVDPQSLLADELRARGINARSAPGLFKSGGLKAWDNLPAAEWGGYRYEVGEDGNGYLDQDGVIAALEAEMRGEPVQVGEQADLQIAADAKEAEDRFRAAEPDPEPLDIPALGDQGPFIPDPTQDITTGEERMDYVVRSVDGVLRETGLDAAYSTQERQEIISTLNERGGNVEDAVWWQLHRSADADVASKETAQPGMAEEPADTARPRGDDAAREVQRDTGQPAVDTGAEGRGAAQPAQNRPPDERQTEEPATADVGEATTERTDAGEQTVIPGAEQSTERSDEARKADQRREIEARQQQSKKGTTVPQDDAGPLFDTQGDMFDAPAAKAQPAAPSKTQKRLTEILRREWTAREDLPEDATDEFIAASKKVKEARSTLADEFGDDVAKAAIEEIEAGYKPATVRERTDQNPVKKTSPKPRQNLAKTSPKAERTEDFGEKIGGARKDQRSLDMGPVASLTGKEIGGEDIKSMRGAAQQWYRDNLVGESATTRDGWTVAFTNRGLRKSTSKGEGLLRYVPAIRGVIEEGVVVDSRPGRDSGTKAMHFIAAPVEVAGEVKEIVVAVREAPDGKFQYDLSWFDGGRAQAKRPDGDLAQAPISPVWNQPLRDMNIGTLSSLRKRRVDPAKLQAMLPDMKARLDKLMIRGVDLSIDTGMQEQGAVQFGPGGIEILIGNTLDGINTVNHEAIHVLRQRGLFKDAEWTVLSEAAEARWMREHNIEARYPELSRAAQIEEAVAEAFAAHVDGRVATGRVKAIFGKIQRFFRAMKEALLGQGIRQPEDIFEAVERGEIGARDGRVTGEDLVKYQRPSAAVRKMTPEGVQATAVSTHSAAIPDDTRFERFRRLIQDRMLVLRRMTEATEKQTGQTIRKEDDPYYAEERYSGRVGYLLDEIDANYTKPIVDLIAKAPIEITDQNGKVRKGSEAVSLWLMARHAKERNAHIASINDQMPDGGSGLTNAEADAILQQAAQNKTRLDQIGALTDKLGKEMITAREDAGLLSAQDAHIWRTMYKHYVPLQKFAENDMFDGVVNDSRTAMGRKFNVRGKEGRQALGRSTEAFDPLATLLTQAMEVTVRAEKNRVAKVMFDFAARYPNPAMYEISMPETQRFFDKSTGKVDTRVVGPAARQLAENEMALKVDGKEYRITFKDPRLAESLGQLGTNEMGKVTAIASQFSRYFSSINTMLSPPFIIVNAFRDMMTAQVNLGQAGGDVPGKLRKAAMRDWVKALRGAHRGLKGKTDTEYAKWFKEYSEVGGRIHFWKIETPESESIDFKKRVNMASRGKLAGTVSRLALPSVRDNPVLSVIETANMAVDNAVRLATYAEARRNGWSKADAASMAKNLTVNFNRRGEIGATMNAWYPFANAAIQGSHVILKAMKARQVQKIVGGMILFGFANDLLAAMLSATDDDGELEYDQLPAYKSERNIIVATPLSETGYVTIPLPYGYNVFFFAGQQMGKIVRGVKSPGEAAGQLLAATVGAFSPITGETGFQMLAPTVLDFANEFDNNRNWLGRPIRPENPYGDYGPQSYKEYNASAPSRTVARGLNYATGGNPLEPGLVDISPEYIDHFFQFMTGGAGRFAGRAYGLAERAAEGTLGDTEVYEIPLARVMITESSDFLNQNRYFEFREAVQEARAQKKMAAELGVQITPDMQDLNALWPALSQAEKRRKKARLEIEAVYSNDTLSARERQRRLKPLNERQNNIYMDFNKRFIGMMGPQAE